MIRAAASPREVAPPRLRALWTDLLAWLSLAAVACSQAQTRVQLRALGVRRTGTVVANLAREMSRVRRQAAAEGVAVQPLELQRRIGALANGGTLAEHLQGVAAAYRLILVDPETPPDGPLAQWLAGQQRVHRVQIDSLENRAGPPH